MPSIAPRRAATRRRFGSPPGPAAVEPAADVWRPCPPSAGGPSLRGIDRVDPPGLLRRGATGASHGADPLGGQAIPPAVLTELRRGAGAGRRLPGPLAAAAGTALVTDLSGVRLHTDDAADRLARSVQAEAFTHGQDIYLTRGRYAPHTGDGSRILAHELAHVAQGTAGASGAAGTVGRADDVAESAADAVADRIAPLLRRSAQGAGDEAPLPALMPAPLTLPTPGDGVRRSVLRRRIETTSADIAALRGKKRGLAKYTGGKDGLDRIGKLLDRHGGLADQGAQVASLTAIAALVDKWLRGNRGTASRELVALLEQLGAEAVRDLGQARAQQRYVNDLRAGEQDRRMPRLEHENTGTPFSQQLTDTMAKKANWAMQGLAATNDQDPRRQATEVIRAAGLTEAEVAAIKFFTGNDFLYINPATANNDTWMQGQIGEMQKMADRGGSGQKIDAATAKSEGATHAGVIMQGLAKMEPKRGKVYRGARMTPAEFAETYGSRKQLTYHSFVSSAINPDPAWNYAAGGGAMPPRPDQTVSVKCIFEVDDARDLRPLSLIKFEDEWLLLPGATFAITAIEDEKGGKPGRAPAATAWKVVHLKQIKAPPVPPQPAPAAGGAAAGGAPDLSSPAARALADLAAGKFVVPPGAGGSSGSAMQKLARGDFSTPASRRRRS